MASFRSSFDPCKRSATAAAATAPAASGMVCRLSTIAKMKNTKIILKKFSNHIKNSSINSTRQLWVLNLNIFFISPILQDHYAYADS